MAEGKKSFILYLTQRPIFDGLSNEDAGKLIKEVFAYVADEHPQPEGIVGYSFNIIKPTLKMDLVKYEDKKVKMSENAKKRWETKESKSVEKNANECNCIQKDTDNVNDNVNVNVNDNDNVLNIRINTLFNMFWREYPKHIGEDECRDWFTKNIPDDELMRKIITSLQVQKSTLEWTKEKGKFIPKPINWLERGGWKDEVECHIPETTDKYADISTEGF